MLLISVWKVPECCEHNDHGPLDWIGAAVATIGLSRMVYGLIESPRLGFSNAMVLVSLIGGAVFLGKARWLTRLCSVFA